MAPSFEVVTDHWPLVVSRLPSRIDAAELEKFIAKHDALIARRSTYVTITDCTSLEEVPNAAIRKRIAEWTKGIEGSIRLHNIATSMLIGSPIVRGALTALHWIAPPPQPTLITANRYEATVFVLDALAKRGIAVPSSAIVYRDAQPRDARSAAVR